MNRAVLNTPDPATVPAPADTLAFHRALPGYEATPLVAAPDLAAELGLEQVYIKDESSRSACRPSSSSAPAGRSRSCSAAPAISISCARRLRIRASAG